MTHLLVTNDFPPKVGGIQSYLWEMWRRLPPERFCVITTAHPGAAAFDAAQAFRIVRRRERVLLPTPALTRHIDALAGETGASLVVLDPALPLGALGPRLGRPYALVVHGAEVSVPGRLPGTRAVVAAVLRGATAVIAAGRYPAAEARGAAAGDGLREIHEIPPGVDVERFRPSSPAERADVRRRWGLAAGGPLVVSITRLVPRKGVDTLIAAAALLADDHPDLVVAVAGAGRDRPRLERLAQRAGVGASVRFLGRVSEEELGPLHGAADVFAMPCRTRWGGLEQEGFGIVFVEAAASGVPAVAGASGGADEAVEHAETGLVVTRPDDAGDVAAALESLIAQPERRRRMGEAARRRAVERFSNDVLAARLDAVLGRLEYEAEAGNRRP